MKSAEERFFAKVVKTEGCWTWLASKDRNGYGKFSPNGPHSQTKAHRFSWLVHVGPIPEGMFVCHRCDNPECTNPDHLFLGTAQDNMDDKVLKGRWVGNAPRRLPPNPHVRRLRIGERLEEHLPTISARRDNGETLSEIAASFGCDKDVIRKILDRNGLYEPIKPGPRTPHNVRTATLRERLPEILSRYEKGEAINSLAKSIGANHRTLTKIIRTASITS